MNLITISSVADFESVLASKSTVAIFKHSTRCAISSMAYNRIKTSWVAELGDMPLYYLDLIQHRDISNLIAEKLGVMHESPQLILLKNGEVLYSASHSAINVKEVSNRI